MIAIYSDQFGSIRINSDQFGYFATTDHIFDVSGVAQFPNANRNVELLNGEPLNVKAIGGFVCEGVRSNLCDFGQAHHQAHYSNV